MPYKTMGYVFIVVKIQTKMTYVQKNSFTMCFMSYLVYEVFMLLLFIFLLFRLCI